MLHARQHCASGQEIDCRPYDDTRSLFDRTYGLSSFNTAQPGQDVKLLDLAAQRRRRIYDLLIVNDATI
jgi:hypothetical protein